MACKKCGNPLAGKDGYCDKCRVTIAKPIPHPPVAGEKRVIDSKKGKKTKTLPDFLSKKDKKLTKKKLTVILVAVGLVLFTLVATAIYMFPARISFKESDFEKSTKVGAISDVSIKIKANQPILDVRYSVNPDNPTDYERFTDYDSSGLFSTEFKMDKLKVETGNSVLHLYVKTLFGKKVHRVELFSEVGYSSPPQNGALVGINDESSLVSNELLVVFKEDTSQQDIDKLISSYNAEVVGVIYYLNQYQVRFSGSGEAFIKSTYEKMVKESIVESVSYNISTEGGVNFIPNDADYDEWSSTVSDGNNWGLECINAPGAWEYRNDLQSVNVGVLDSFLYNDHEDLQIDDAKCSILPTDDFPKHSDLYNYYKNTNHSFCPLTVGQYCIFCAQKDHGTHCVGIIGGDFNNGKGMAGVAPNSDVHFKTEWYYELNANGQLEVKDTLMSMVLNISEMVMSDCRVVSMSFGASQPSSPSFYESEYIQLFENMVVTLENMNYDFLLVKAAGNSNDDASKYIFNRIMTGGEHAKKHVIVVGAVENTASSAGNYNMAKYSNYGNMIDVTAPGSAIYSTISDNRYESFDGTSMATPMVAGAATYLYGINPNITYATVKNTLLSTATGRCMKNGKIYKIINLKAAADWILDNTEGMTDRLQPTGGYFSGIVQDAQTLKIIGDAQITITNDDTKIKQEVNVENGQYWAFLDEGTYTMDISAIGYLSETIYNIKIDANSTTYNTMMNLVPISKEKGEAAGTVVDVFVGEAIPDAKVKAFKGVNNRGGTPVAEVNADGLGKYSLTLDPGNYTITAEANGYITGSTSILVLPGEKKEKQDCTLTPTLNNGEVRAVLTWNEFPGDIDSHIVGDGTDNADLHVYFENTVYERNGKLLVQLDADETEGYGPETTSVYTGETGDYTFYIHDFTNRESDNTSALAASGAQVKVYVGGQEEPIIFNVPNHEGTLWKVFKVSNGTVTPVNEMTYCKSQTEVGK